MSKNTKIILAVVIGIFVLIAVACGVIIVIAGTSAKTLSNAVVESSKTSPTPDISKVSEFDVVVTDFESICKKFNAGEFKDAYELTDEDFRRQFTFDDFMTKVATPLKNCKGYVFNTPFEARKREVTSKLIQYYFLGKVTFNGAPESDVRLSYTFRDGKWYFIGVISKTDFNDLNL